MTTRREVTNWVKDIALSPPEEFEQEREIEGVTVRVSVISRRPSRKGIAGYVANANSSADIGLNAVMVLEERIRKKSEVCALLSKPIWLAMLNDYWLADAETYSVASRQINLKHCFERVFLVSGNGAVNELAVGAYQL